MNAQFLAIEQDALFRQACELTVSILELLKKNIFDFNKATKYMKQLNALLMRQRQLKSSRKDVTEFFFNLIVTFSSVSRAAEAAVTWKQFI
jgi:hypothetical protein